MPVKRAFSGSDDLVAGTLAKSTLLANLAKAVRRQSNVVFFSKNGAVVAKEAAAFAVDGRHMRRDILRDIMQGFVRVYFWI